MPIPPQSNPNQIPYQDPNRERIDEMAEQIKKLNLEVTYLRNQNSQLQAAQKGMQSNQNREFSQGQNFDRGQRNDRGFYNYRGYNQDRGYNNDRGFNNERRQNFDRGQGSGSGFDKRSPQGQNRTWNTGPNNGGVPTPLDQPANQIVNQSANQPVSQDKPPTGVYLAEAALSGWCRLHKTSQHLELECSEFQTATSIFQYEVENNVNAQEIVPSNSYDSPVLVLNHAPFPASQENVPEEPDSHEDETDQICNGDEVARLFNEEINDNGPLDQEEVHVEEVQMFQRQGLRDMPHRRPQPGGPFTTSIPPNNFSTPPDPNASNNPSFPHVSKQYLSKDRQAQAEPQKEKIVQAGKDKVEEPPKEVFIDMSEEQMASYVAEEFKKLKVNLSAFELLRFPAIRKAVLSTYDANSKTSDKPYGEHVSRTSSFQPVNTQSQTQNKTNPPPGDRGKEKDRTQVAQVDTQPTLFQGKTETPPFLISV